MKCRWHWSLSGRDSRDVVCENPGAPGLARAADRLESRSHSAITGYKPVPQPQLQTGAIDWWAVPTLRTAETFAEDESKESHVFDEIALPQTTGLLNQTVHPFQSQALQTLIETCHQVFF